MGLIRTKTTDTPAPVRTASTGRATPEGVDSLISTDMVLDGDCRTEGALRVDGHVKGDIQAGRLMVGEGGRVGGNVTGQTTGSDDRDTVIINGRVDGAVNAPRVQIGPGGAVGGGMAVKEAVIRGRVSGGIRTEGRLLLEETAIVEGDVVAGRLGLKEGGQVFGTIRIGDAPSGKRAQGGAAGS